MLGGTRYSSITNVLLFYRSDIRGVLQPLVDSFHTARCHEIQHFCRVAFGNLNWAQSNVQGRGTVHSDGIYSLGHGLSTFPAMPWSTQASVLCGTVK